MVKVQGYSQWPSGVYMKLVYIVLCGSVVCATAFAISNSSPPTSDSPPANAQLECSVTSEGKTIVSGKSEPFVLGEWTSLNIPLPTPYQDFLLLFNYFASNSDDNDPPHGIPYIQAFFAKIDQAAPKPKEGEFTANYAEPDSDFRDVFFDASGLLPGSKMYLVGVYNNKKPLLKYRCSFDFL
jgi:hypothetical protein